MSTSALASQRDQSAGSMLAVLFLASYARFVPVRTFAIGLSACRVTAANVATFLLAALALGASSASHAIPAFARQTGNACSTCHFQHYPALNDFGRDFKAGGYTDMGKQEKIEKPDLSLPSVLNASLFFKIRYLKTNGADTSPANPSNSGDVQFPDEFSLLFGGRASHNIGFFLEGQLSNHDAPFLANFKIPFMYDVGSAKAGVIPFTSEDLGVAFGFELLNTGAVHNLRTIEQGEDTSAQQYIGTGTAAEGLALVYAHKLFHVNVTKWSPNHVAGESGTNGRPTANYVRAAVTPVFNEWDLAVGTQLWSGTAKREDPANPGAVADVATKAWAVDAQAQGKIGNLPLGVYFSHAVAKATPAGGTPNLFNESEPNNKKATAISAELGIIPNKATLMLAFLRGNTGEATNSGDNALTLGGTYMIAQNVQLQFLYTKRSGSRYDPANPNLPETGNKLMTLMLSAGF